MNFKPNLEIKLCGFIQFIFTLFFFAISITTDFPVPSLDPSGISVNVITFFLASLKQSLVFNSPGDLNKEIFKLFLHRFRFWFGVGLDVGLFQTLSSGGIQFVGNNFGSGCCDYYVAFLQRKW